METTEKLIKATKTFITELTFVQDSYFQGLATQLGLTEEGKDWLFDYIYNHDKEDTFEEYLAKYNVTFGQIK